MGHLNVGFDSIFEKANKWWNNYWGSGFNFTRISPQNTFFSMMELAIIEFNVAWILTESGSPSGKERSMHSTSSRVDFDSVKLVLSRAMTALPLPASSSSSSSSWSPCPAHTVSLPRLMPKHFGLAYSFMHDSDTTALPNLQCKLLQIN